MVVIWENSDPFPNTEQRHWFFGDVFLEVSGVRLARQQIETSVLCVVGENFLVSIFLDVS